MRGSLFIPDGAEVITLEDEEFGQKYIVTDDTLLCSAPPPKNLDKLIKDPHTKKTTLDQTNSHYALNNDRSAVLVFEDLKKGDQVFANKVKGRNHILQVVTYVSESQKREDMPESGREITIHNKGVICNVKLTHPCN